MSSTQTRPTTAKSRATVPVSRATPAPAWKEVNRSQHPIERIKTKASFRAREAPAPSWPISAKQNFLKSSTGVKLERDMPFVVGGVRESLCKETYRLANRYFFKEFREKLFRHRKSSEGFLHVKNSQPCFVHSMQEQKGTHASFWGVSYECLPKWEFKCATTLSQSRLLPPRTADQRS